MNKKYRYILVTLVVLLAIVAFAVYFVRSFSLPVYSYESSDSEFADIEVPWMGRTLEMVETNFENYKRRINKPNLKLYHTSSRIWSSPNLWIDNITSKRWDIPFAAPSPTPKHE